MCVHRARHGIVALLFIVVALCAAPRPGLAAVVEAKLRAELVTGLPSFVVLAGDGTVDAPRALVTEWPAAGWAWAQVDDLAEPGPGDFEVLEIRDLTTELTATGETGFGFAQASLRSYQLTANSSVRVDPATPFGFNISAAVARNFEVTLHGAGTLLVSIPFILEGQVTGPYNPDELFASAYASIFATRTRRNSGVSVDELFFDSSARLYPLENPPDHPDLQVDTLTLAVNFLDGDTLRIFLDASTQINSNLQPVPLPAGGPLLVAAIAVLMRRRR